MGVGEGASSGGHFVGRARELAELRQALERAVGGQGQLCLLSGEPGIGKTRLAEEVALEAATRRVQVLWGRCWDSASAPSYWPWVQLTRALLADESRGPRPVRLLPEIAQVLPELSTEFPEHSPPADPQNARFRLFDAVARLIRERSQDRPLMLAIDDLHDADESSLEMLKFTGQQLRECRVLIVATYREAEVRCSAGASRLVAEIARGGHEIILRGLSEAEIGQWLSGTTGHPENAPLAASLHRLTAGNPLFLDGVVRVLAAEQRLDPRAVEGEVSPLLPDSVRGAIHRRLDLLSSESRSLLSVAAAVGQEFDIGLLARASGRASDTIADRLSQASDIAIIKSIDPGKYVFSHPLHREALYSELNAQSRAQVHGAIAAALETMHTSSIEGHLAEIAHHRRLSGDIDKALEYSLRAGEAAMRVFAYEDAVLHLQAARGLMEQRGDGAAAQARLLERIGEAMAFLDSEHEHRTALLESAAGLYRQTGDDESLARVYASLGQVFIWTVPASTRMNRAMEYLHKAEAILAGKPEGAALAAVYLAMAQGADYVARYDDGLEWATRARQIALRLGNREQAISALTAYGEQLLFKGRLAEALAALNDSAAQSELLDAPESCWRTALALAKLGIGLWDPLFSVNTINAELAHQRTAKASFVRRGFELALAMALRVCGRLHEARAMLSAAGRPDPSAEGPLLYAEGEWERGLELMLQSAESRRRIGNLHDLAHDLAMIARIQRALGQFEDARATLEEASALATNDPHIRMEVFPEMASLMAELGEPREQLLDACRAQIASGENWLGIEGHLERAEADVAAANGDRERATRHFARGEAIFRRYVLPFETAETLERWAVMLARAGQHRDANGKLDAALAIYQRMGPQRWIDRVTGLRNQRPDSAAAPRSPIFHKTGDHWTLAYDGSVSTVKDLKGLGYIAVLIGNPNAEFHVIELVSGGVRTPGATSDEGDAVLDSRAKAEFRAKLSELRHDLDTAEEANDSGRAAAIRTEIESITDHLTAALGLGGRDRRATSNAERARSTVGKNIRNAIQTLERVNPPLARHLSSSIRTGIFCSYRPERPVPWQF